MNAKVPIVPAFCLLLAAGAALGADAPPAAAGKKAAPASYPAAAAPAPSPGTFSGKVVESMDAATYTYVLVDTGKDKRWAAVPRAPVKVGEKVSVVGAMEMRKHHSATLKRDFDVIYFAADLHQERGPAPAAGTAMPPLPQGHPPMPGSPPVAGATLPPGHPPMAAAAPAPKIDPATLPKAKDAKTIQEVVAGKGALKGKEVTVRGKVVKFNANIMGRNWIHIGDGSGPDGKNQITVTSAGTAKVGDNVVAAGPLATDKDFGGGYKFAVIVENARISVQ